MDHSTTIDLTSIHLIQYLHRMDDCSLRAWRAYRDMQAEWRDEEEMAARMTVERGTTTAVESCGEEVIGFDLKGSRARKRMRDRRRR